MQKPLIITSGEPAGIGPDLLLKLLKHQFSRPIVAIVDKNLLWQRAKSLNITINLPTYDPKISHPFSILHQQLPKPSIPGKLQIENSSAVLQMLDTAIQGCLQGEFSALVTAPVHKAIIQQSGIQFSGHTEYLAKACKSAKVVMMFLLENICLALATTHIPLAQVPKMITSSTLRSTIELTHKALQSLFSIQRPIILLTGLNPHAGEDGTIGTEEVEVIFPTLKTLRAEGLQILGPISADTALPFAAKKKVDVIISLYHDQLLPALKTIGFGKIVNLTVGLPFVRTSVDHGTALELAGTGQADASSLIAACSLAITLTTT